MLKYKPFRAGSNFHLFISIGLHDLHFLAFTVVLVELDFVPE